MRAKREDIIKVFNRLKETIILTPSGTDKDIDLTEIYRILLSFVKKYLIIEILNSLYTLYICKTKMERY